MAFDFPASPSIDQEYVAGTVTYIYNGTGWVIKGTITGNFVSKSGDTMTGDLTISKADPVLWLKGTGSAGWLAGERNGTRRWTVALGNNTSETGSNVGSNFAITPHSDTGTQLPEVLGIARTTGQVSLGSTVASTSPTTGALTVAGGLGVAGKIYAPNMEVKYGTLRVSNGLNMAGFVVGISYTAHL